MAKASSKGSAPAKEREPIASAFERDSQELSMRQGRSHVRHAVLEAAADLFAERGFGGTNLADVAGSLRVLGRDVAELLQTAGD